MADKTGAARLRQAIENQRDAGEVCFSLPIGEAYAICDEVEDELARLSWAAGVPVPRDADGEVVPLGTEKLYTDDGEMIRVGSICYSARLWYVRRMHSDKTYRIDSLHLHLYCPDSWEKLEEDVDRYDDESSVCAYYNRPTGECIGCPAIGAKICDKEVVIRDVMRRAKVLAKRDAKEADHD